MPNLSSIQPYALDIALAAGVLAIICFILAVIAIAKANRLKRRLNAWKNISSSADLEQVFSATADAVTRLERELDEARAQMSIMEETLRKKVSTPAIQRYNAFSEVGSDLSFSVALVDGEGDGVVLTSIYGREDSVTYGKPVTAGDSSYLLTEEEQSVIAESMGQARRSTAYASS
ncbi:DUF4446 family protein [Alicyclobacillus acidiphilus]|uniref:DUF4446 family protein n=1 Tax=Alicyclobacillus acidiphilus TaxID=182455 RepID=UPI00083362FE|nr:DUF4446 family protein [Alicyclobacillus acidiphilus]